jgi:hypothetical protein
MRIAALGRRCTVVASVVTVATFVACTGDDPVFPPHEQANDAASPVTPSGADATTAEAAGGNDGDAGDAGDAGDGNLCKQTPQSPCLSTAKNCSNNCRVTFNNCKAACPNDANLAKCINTCKAGIDSCQVPCKGDCVTCANANGSCTGSPDCEAQMYRGS